MDSPQQPVVSTPQPETLPGGPVVLPNGAVPADGATEIATSPVTQPIPEPLGQTVQAATRAPRRRVVSDFSGDLIISLQSLLGTVVVAIFVITFIVQAFQIPSESMENTLLVGDYLLVNKLCYGGRNFGQDFMPYQKIQRGDIIVFHYPVDPQEHFVKRVIGVPGDRLRLVNKKVFINGKPIDEPYVHYLEPANNLFRDNFPRVDVPVFNMEGKWWLQMRKLVEDGELIVPEGHYFVMGDNRDDSQDSRYWGFVPRENIIGRPLVIYWSVRDWDRNPAASLSGRLQHLGYAITHIFQITRWNRTLRLVH